MKVSIVIPVYNVEKYICRCIDSVLDQSYKNFEVVVVDDQSPDRSIELVKSYQSEKITIISHKQNKGLSASRNTGVNHCSGDYLLFLDSDDYLQPNALEKGISIIQNHHSDIVSFKSKHIDDDGKTWPVSWHEKFKGLTSGDVSISDHPNLVWDVAAWNKLINLNFYRANNIEFDEGQRHFEDHLFSLELFTKTNKVSVIDDELHYYAIRSDASNPSITQSNQFDSVLYRLRMMESVISYLNSSERSYLIVHFCELIIYFYRQVLQLAYESADTKDSFLDVITRFQAIFAHIGFEPLSKYPFEAIDLALHLKYLSHNHICCYFESPNGRIKCADTLLRLDFPEKETLDVDWVSYSQHYSYRIKPSDHFFSKALFMLAQPFYMKWTYFKGDKGVHAIASKNLAVLHIQRSGLFDEEYYSINASLNFKSMRQAINHYVFEGEDSRIQPNSYFNPSAYLEANPDLRHWKGSLFGHFLIHGISKGRAIR